MQRPTYAALISCVQLQVCRTSCQEARHASDHSFLRSCRSWIYDAGAMSWQKHITVIGGANMDIQGYPLEALRRHDSNPGAVRVTPGGVGRNVAENLARLGVSVDLITAVGADDPGKTILRGARDAGISCDASLTAEHGQTATYLAVLDERGDMDVAIIQSGIYALLDRTHVEKHKSTVESSAALVLDTNLEVELLHYLCTAFQHLPIFIDPVSSVKAEKLVSLFSCIHTLKPNEREAEALTGVSCDTDRGCLSAAAALRAHGVQNVVITRGERGYVIADRTGPSLIPAVHSQVVSATGAGDAFMAGLVYGFLGGHGLSRAAEYGRVLSSWALGAGATIASDISAQRLEKEVKNQ